jgi:hypothetical protein
MPVILKERSVLSNSHGLFFMNKEALSSALIYFVLPFQILIRATRTYRVQGDIAVDDFQFINCNYPGFLSQIL